MDAFSISQLSLLEERLETFRPSLVIIDSLRRINAGREVSENSAEFTDTLYQLKELLTRYEAAGIVIHHSNKSKDAVGVGRVRGSSAISGAVWGVWQLDHIPKPDPHNKKRFIIDPKDPTRILSITARDIEGQRLLIELDPDRNQWNNLGEEGQAEEDKCDRALQADLILDLLKPIAPVGLEARELNDKLELGRGIYSVLNRLLGKGIIGSRPSPTDKRRTVYYHPSTGQNPTQGVSLDSSRNINKRGDSPPPIPCVQDVIEYSQNVTINGLKRSITSRSQIDHKSITTKDDIAVRSTLNPVLVSSPEVDHNYATDRGGEGVENLSDNAIAQAQPRGIAKNPLVENVEQLPPPESLAAQITKCESWSAALELIDDVSIATGKNRGTVLKKLIRCFDRRDRVRLLALLDLHVKFNPSDERASKALEIAQKYTSPEVNTLEEQT